MTATFQMAREIGWDYFEKLSRQKVTQVQSSADPPKKLAGERAIMADGNEYNLIQLKEKGEPVEIVYPAEGTPLIVGPLDYGGLRSVHALVKDKPGRKPLAEIKLMEDDPAAVEQQAEEIKARYTKYFKV